MAVAKTITAEPRKRSLYDCSKCPAYCCSVYERVRVTMRDVNRLAAHFNVPFEIAQRRFTKDYDGERILKRKSDPVLDEACMFLDQETRRCSIYNARPSTCREYPITPRCAYYDLIQFERKQQGDDSVVPVVRITFQD